MSVVLTYDNTDRLQRLYTILSCRVYHVEIIAKCAVQCNSNIICIILQSEIVLFIVVRQISSVSRQIHQMARKDAGRIYLERIYNRKM